MGYHDAREIPNYWAYAKNFVLQDHLFEPIASWSLPAHLYLVSGWSAICPQKTRTRSMRELDSAPNAGRHCDAPVDRQGHVRLDRHHLPAAQSAGELALLRVEGDEPDCEDDEAATCEPQADAQDAGHLEPAAGLHDVQEDGQIGNIQCLDSFYEAAHRRRMRPAERLVGRSRTLEGLRTPATLRLRAARPTSRR